MRVHGLHQGACCLGIWSPGIVIAIKNDAPRPMFCFRNALLHPGKSATCPSCAAIEFRRTERLAQSTTSQLRLALNVDKRRKSGRRVLVVSARVIPPVAHNLRPTVSPE